MTRASIRPSKVLLPLLAAVALAAAPLRSPAMGAMVDGLEGASPSPVFQLFTGDGFISTPDGNSHYFWGYGDGNTTGALAQYPGPTLIVNEGDTVTVRLSNRLPVPASIVFPGQANVQVTVPGTPGLLTSEAPPAVGTVEYRFVATRPGTFTYHSGTQTALQVEMGLVGALVVRPAGFDHMAMKAYGDASTAFDRETLFLETEMDPRVHVLAYYGLYDSIDMSDWKPTLWFLNGRSAPDTMQPAFAEWLPHQPYDCMPMMHPGQRILMRIVSAGRDGHPFHFHGNHATLVARDGRPLDADAATPGLDSTEANFTFNVPPGGTADAIFEWTGAKLGWDIYGHKLAIEPLEPGEYAPDHAKKFPVALPSIREVTQGAMYSGSPFLGKTGKLLPGQTAESGYYFMWHSHNEREMTTDNVFPGGLMTMLVVEAPWVPLP